VRADCQSTGNLAHLLRYLSYATSRNGLVTNFSHQGCNGQIVGKPEVGTSNKFRFLQQLETVAVVWTTLRSGKLLAFAFAANSSEQLKKLTESMKTLEFN